MIPFSFSPGWATLLNFLTLVAAGAESTGLTNVLTTSGGKAGAIAAAVIAGANMVAHGLSAPQAGPLVDTGGTSTGAQAKG